MKKVLIQRPKLRRSPPPDPLPIDPRDPDVVRAKERIYAAARSARRRRSS
jgi:hypothetical protein